MMMTMVVKATKKRVVYLGLSKNKSKTAVVYDGESYLEIPLEELELTVKDYNSACAE